jgi:SAM-dependent methyltransferase
VNTQPAGSTDVVCRVCGSRNNAYLCRTFNEHSRTKWLDNFRCLDCGSVFIGNVISDEELAGAYSTVDEAAYYRETADASAPKFNKAAQDLSRVVSHSAEILDIGGGNGAFVRALRAQGFTNLSIHEIPGADLPELASLTRHVYRDTDYATVPSASFDAITMMDVMEHVPSPDWTIAAAKRMLRPGGVLYLHTPVVTPLDRAMHAIQKLPLVGSIGRAWQRARTSIFHLQNYTARSLSLLMAKNGFEIVALRQTNELSWPVARYVRIYLIEKRGLPKALAPLLVLLLTPFIRSRLNANKGVLTARVAR